MDKCAIHRQYFTTSLWIDAQFEFAEVDVESRTRRAQAGSLVRGAHACVLILGPGCRLLTLHEGSAPAERRESKARSYPNPASKCRADTPPY